MKLYKVQYKSYNDIKFIHVVARSINKAIEVAEKWISKNSYSSPDIKDVSYQDSVEAVQK